MKVSGMFKNPMTIMMVMSVAMMFFLPKMMANLDPEQLEVSKRVGLDTTTLQQVVTTKYS